MKEITVHQSGKRMLFKLDHDGENFSGPVIFDVIDAFMRHPESGIKLDVAGTQYFAEYMNPSESDNANEVILLASVPSSAYVCSSSAQSAFGLPKDAIASSTADYVTDFELNNAVKPGISNTQPSKVLDIGLETNHDLTTKHSAGGISMHDSGAIDASATSDSSLESPDHFSNFDHEACQFLMMDLKSNISFRSTAFEQSWLYYLYTTRKAIQEKWHVKYAEAFFAELKRLEEEGHDTKIHLCDKDIFYLRSVTSGNYDIDIIASLLYHGEVNLKDFFAWMGFDYDVFIRWSKSETVASVQEAYEVASQFLEYFTNARATRRPPEEFEFKEFERDILNFRSTDDHYHHLVEEGRIHVPQDFDAELGEPKIGRILDWVCEQNEPGYMKEREVIGRIDGTTNHVPFSVQFENTPLGREQCKALDDYQQEVCPIETCECEVCERTPREMHGLPDWARPHIAVVEETEYQPIDSSAPTGSTDQKHAKLLGALQTLHDCGFQHLDDAPLEELLKRMQVQAHQEANSRCADTLKEDHNSGNAISQEPVNESIKLVKDLAKVMTLPALRKFAQGNPQLEDAVDKISMAEVLELDGLIPGVDEPSSINSPAAMTVSRQNDGSERLVFAEDYAGDLAQWNTNSHVPSLSLGSDNASSTSQVANSHISAALAALPSPPAASLRDLFDRIRIEDDIHISEAALTDEYTNGATTQLFQNRHGSSETCFRPKQGFDNAAAESKLKALIGIVQPGNDPSLIYLSPQGYTELEMSQHAYDRYLCKRSKPGKWEDECLVHPMPSEKFEDYDWALTAADQLKHLLGVGCG